MQRKFPLFRMTIRLLFPTISISGILKTVRLLKFALEDQSQLFFLKLFLNLFGPGYEQVQTIVNDTFKKTKDETRSTAP